ncbi:TOMM precursor leader peptide-binding protein [Streptomyces polygonati]|uniref:TOMM leader peptide-binding protein n=1 Tax=Streptomyces polygonati TaxID=1617087 RepID=A0ABV8HJT2_9ACTN
MVSPDERYQEIAGTRPRIRRDVLYTRTPTGVHFHNARGGFSVVMPSAYRFASLIVPHLTGANTVASLCQGLGEKQRDMVTQLVGTLYARGFARDAVPPAPGAPAPPPEVARRFAAQIDYIDHYSDEAAERFQRFRQTRVAVLGDDQLARWAALSLIRNGCATVGVPAGLDITAHRFAEVRAEAEALTGEGCPVTIAVLETDSTAGEFGWADLDGYDLVLVTGADAARRTAALAEVPAGRMLVPAWEFGGSVVIGPLLTDGSRGCWTCAALRLGANGDPAHAADLWSAFAPGGGATADAAGAGAMGAARGPVAAMVGNLLGYEAFRLATGALPAETRGQLIIQDLDSLDTAAEPLLPHPRCPRCGVAAGGRAEPATGRLAELAERAELGGLPGRSGPAVGEPEAEGSGGEAAPGSVEGARSGDPDEPAEAAAEEDAAQAALAEITDRDILVRPAAGVFRRYDDEEWTQTPLKVSAVVLGTGHGAARTVSAFDVHHVAGARLRALHRAAEVYAEHVVPLPEVLTGAALDAARGKWAALAPRALSIASGLDGSDVPAWCATTSLLGGETVLVPAAALRTFGPYNRDRLAEPTSAGTGAGGTPGAATARAVMTALTHDALRAALRGRIRITAVDPAALEKTGDAELTFLVRSAANLGVPLEILDLGASAESPAPVVLARATDSATGERRWAASAGQRWRDAALEAVRDLLGACQLSREPRPPAPLDTGDPLLPDFDPDTLAPTSPPGSAPASAPDLTAGTDWPTLAAQLRAAGRDLLAAPVPAPDLAAGRLYVTRVLLTSGGAPDDDR